MIALAASAATAGAASSFAGTVASTFAVSNTADFMGIIFAMSEAALASLTSQAAITLASNRGDIGKAAMIVLLVVTL